MSEWEKVEFYATRRFLEGCCLEALRMDREKWAPRMGPTLFRSVRSKIYDAIMQAEDPKDPVQIAVQLNTKTGWSEFAELINYTIAAPADNDEQISYRLGKLISLQQSEQLAEMIEKSKDMVQTASPGDVRTFIEANMPAVSEGVLGPFAKAKSLDEAVVEETEIGSIVRCVLYPGGISTIVGAGGLGKSWLAIWMGLCIANGEFWLGMQVKEPRRVGYMCLEMPGVAIRNRIKNLTRGKFPKESRQRFLYTGLEDTGRAVDVLDETFRMSMATWVADQGLDVLIVDPLRNTHTVNEDKSTEMGNVLRVFSSLGCAVLLVHHVTESTGRSRGSTAIRDWSDSVLNLSQKESGSLWVGWEKRPRFAAVGGDFEVVISAVSDGMIVERTQKGNPWEEGHEPKEEL